MPRVRKTLSKVPASGIYPKGSLSYEDIMSEVLKISKDSMGAIATYVGRVKSPGLRSREVDELVIEADRAYADRAFRLICDDVKKRYGLQLAVIYQYEGSFRVGEILVMAVVVGKARPEAFAALEEAVRRFKPEGRLRKREVYEGGESEWIDK
jgi:molybdopterin synthase catalytic subunit